MARAMTQISEPPLDRVPSAPSFDYLSEIATRVIQELRIDSNDTLSESTQQNDNDDDFEFCFVPRHSDSFPVSADDIFRNGQIIPTYPLFNHNAVIHASVTSIPTQTPQLGAPPRRLPLRELMFLEQGKVNDTKNELDGVAEGTYCVWTPPCKKTNSSSKRWKLLDLLPRSHGSDGKGTSKVAPKHSSAEHGGAAAKLVWFFTNANGIGRNSQPFSKASAN